MKGAKNWLRFALLVGLFPSCVNDPIGRSHEVVGSGDPAIDAPAVQAAVDMGGTVTLEGTFDFGDQGVKVTKSVDISGNRTASGDYQTKIINGFNSFLIQEGESGPDIQVSIENLSFDGSTGSAIVVQTGHVTVKRNKIRNIKYRQSSAGKLVGSGVTIGDFAKSGSISGVLIEENDIEINTEYNPKLHFSWGIFIRPISVESLSKKVNIVRNRIGDFAGIGILAVGSEGGSLLIRDNVIDAGSRGAYYGIGMHRQDGLELGPVSILENSITLDGLNGIGLADVCGARIENNMIEISGRNVEGNAGIWLNSSNSGPGSKDNFVLGNQFRGASRCGLAVEGGSEEALSEGNVIRGNNFAAMEAKVANLKLNKHTKDNSVQCMSDQDTVMDCGQDNQIEGTKPLECPPVSE